MTKITFLRSSKAFLLPTSETDNLSLLRKFRKMLRTSKANGASSIVLAWERERTIRAATAWRLWLPVRMGNTSGQSVQENGNDEGEPGSGRNDGFGDAPSNGAGGERNPLSQMIESAVEQAMANFQREKADQKADQKTASAYNDETAKLHLVRLQPKENLFTKIRGTAKRRSFHH